MAFYGDSYCADLESGRDYPTYIQMLCQYFKASVTNLGWPGSSVYDSILLQQRDLSADFMVFVWTEPTRLYNKQCRHLNFRSAFEINHKLARPAQRYYTLLQDTELDTVRWQAAVAWQDQQVLARLPGRQRLAHVHAFHTDQLYNFRSGPTMQTRLIDISLEPPVDHSTANHLNTAEKNERVFLALKELLE